MSKYTVLTIDDDVNFANLVEAVLQTLGIRMLSAINGNEGIELAETHQPDLILSDMLLPGMSGNTLISQLKQNPNTAHIPIIAVTAGGEEIMQDAMKAGCDILISKPFDVRQFRKMIQQYAAQQAS